MKKHIFSYGLLGVALAVTYGISELATVLFGVLAQSADATLLLTFFAISALFLLSFIIHICSERVHFPAFVVAIFFGIASQSMLIPITSHEKILSIVVGIGATLILFGGGLETPFHNFKKLIVKIGSLSFFGLFLTAFLFAVSLPSLGYFVGVEVPIAVAVLLGAVLASTDPAAIIPVLKTLRFKNREVKDLVVSESAVTDVTGTLLTIAFLGILTLGGSFVSVPSSFALLLSKEVGATLFDELLYGIVFGVIGWGLLVFLTRTIEKSSREAEAHAAYFLFVPLCIFMLASAFHGSGYLAAFVTGLLFVLSRHLHETEHFFNYTIEGFFKPIIFVLLGALVDVPSLIAFAPIGILAALVFMFVIRPLTVFVTLGPVSFIGGERLSFRDLLFVSFVRETGAIPAVLLITVMSMGLPHLELLVPIGMWVILATLIIEPPLTPFVATMLGVAEPISDAEALRVGEGKTPFVVLGSRGYSFMDRLPYVVSWADKHQIRRVVLLHCPEDKYSGEYKKDVGAQADFLFSEINKKRTSEGMLPLEFEYVSRKGFLQDNIEQLAQEDDMVTTIFVGRKLIDFRLNEIRKLKVPLFFID